MLKKLWIVLKKTIEVEIIIVNTIYKKRLYFMIKDILRESTIIIKQKINSISKTHIF